jgi:hypothetical protein
MKKIKLIKLRNKKRKKNIKISKLYLIFICLTIYLIIIILLIRFFKKAKKNNIVANELDNYNTIIYKGELIQRKQLITEYLSRVTDDNRIVGNEKRRFLNLYYLPEYSNDPIFQENIKMKFLNMISNKKHKTINKIETFFISYGSPFGNSIIILNNALFYCEIIGCHKIILKNHHMKRKWLLKNPVHIEKTNITIMQGPGVDCKDDQIFCLSVPTYDPFIPVFVKPQIRIKSIKDELVRNLPKVNPQPDELYIHLRGGDIFKVNPSTTYAQPPLCFYEKIIKNNTYKNIYILSMDRKNVVLDALMNKYNNIIFNQNSYEYDLSLLINAFNIVASVSSFIISAIKFNDNLKDLWEYDIIRLSEKFLFLHHHLFAFDIKFKIHTMKPSDIYAQKMFKWRNTEDQQKLMLEDTCQYDFVFTKPNT